MSKTARRPKEQTTLGPDYDPPRDEELDRRLKLMLDANAEAKDASERKRIRHASVVELLTAKGITAYPYYDDEGKKRILYPSTETKAKTKKAPPERKRREQERDAPADDDAVVVKSNAPTELSDPFGATRRGLLDIASAKQDATR